MKNRNRTLLSKISLILQGLGFYVWGLSSVADLFHR